MRDASTGLFPTGGTFCIAPGLFFGVPGLFSPCGTFCYIRTIATWTWIFTKWNQSVPCLIQLKEMCGAATRLFPKNGIFCIASGLFLVFRNFFTPCGNFYYIRATATGLNTYMKRINRVKGWFHKKICAMLPRDFFLREGLFVFHRDFFWRSGTFLLLAGLFIIYEPLRLGLDSLTN